MKGQCNMTSWREKLTYTGLMLERTVDWHILVHYIGERS